MCFAKTATDARSVVSESQEFESEAFGPVSAQTVRSHFQRAPKAAVLTEETDGRVKPTRRTAASAAEVKHSELVDGCVLSEEGTQWQTCDRCMPLPGDALVCTLQNAPKGPTRGMVHRAASLGSSKCKQLQRALADGQQLIESGEELCELAEEMAEGMAEGAALQDARAAPRAGTLDGADDQLQVAALQRGLTTSLVVFVKDEPGTLLAITHAVTHASLSILDVASGPRADDRPNAHRPSAERPSAERTDGESLVGAFEFRVQIRSLDQLKQLTASLEMLPQVVHVRRDAMELMLEESRQAGASSGTEALSKFWSYAH